jgi:hypothetical protein
VPLLERVHRIAPCPGSCPRSLASQSRLPFSSCFPFHQQIAQKSLRRISHAQKKH